MLKQKYRTLLLAHLYTLFAVALCLALGRLLFSAMGGLPASIYGMIIFAVGLRIGVISDLKVGAAVDFYLKNLTIVFIPVALGIMQYGDLLQSAGWKILLVAILTTVGGMIVVGHLSQKVLNVPR